MKIFLPRANSFELDNQTWVEQLASGLGIAPPKYWKDHDYEEFQDKLVLIERSIRDAVKRQIANQSIGEESVRNSIRIVLDVNGEERLQEIYIDRGDSVEMKPFVDKISEQVENELAGIDISRRREILVRILGRIDGGGPDE